MKAVLNGVEDVVVSPSPDVLQILHDVVSIQQY